MYSLFKRILLACISFCLLNTSAADTENTTKQLEPINVEITTHLGDAQTFVEGDQISFMLSLDKAAFIYLFYQDAEGRLLQLVPNHKQTNNFYQPGFFMPIPNQQADFKFTVQPPFGEERLWVFATDQQMDGFKSTALGKKLKLIDQSIDNIRLKIKSRAAIRYGESQLTILVTEE